MFRTEHSVEIDAPIEVVWAVLTDFPSYSSWNPFVRRAEGRFELGQTFRLEVQLGTATWNVKQKIIELEPGRSFAWTSRSWYVALATWGVRRHLLEPLGPTRCLVRDSEDTHGPLAGFVERRYGEPLRAGMIAADLALAAESKARYEVAR